MIQTPGLLLTLVAFVAVVGPLVFVHEMGHYLAGRLFGVKADVFSIGFGREIAGFTDRRGTRWKFGWLPLGGYVKFAGDMNPASQPTAEWLSLPAAERSRTFQAKTVWQRAIIVAAGPAVNFLVAMLILTGFALAYGESRTPTTVAATLPGSPAAVAGLKAGDTITALGGRTVSVFDDLVQYVVLRPGERVGVDFVRDRRPLHTDLIIGVDQSRDRFGHTFRTGRLGIASGKPLVVPVNLVQAPVVAVKRTGELLRFMTDTMGQIFTGRRSVSDMNGPVGMAKMAGQQMALGPIEFVSLIALVSINLGFINLLPIPMLDGGHLFFYAIEAVRRRPVGPEVQEWAFRGGLAALLALMLLVTVNDIGSLGIWKSLAGLIG